MSVDKAKEFLVDTTENEEAAAKIQATYLATLVEVSSEMGYDLTEEDIMVAIEEMTGLGESVDDVEVEGFGYGDSLFSGGNLSFGVVANPLRFSWGAAPQRRSWYRRARW